MKKIILPFFCVASLLLGACNGQNANNAGAADSAKTDSAKTDSVKAEAPKTDENKAAEAPKKEKKDIAFEVYNAIPKAHLPKAFANIKRGDNEKIDATVQPDYISAGYEEGECSHYFFFLFCKPIEGTDNYKVYWWDGAGCDGSELNTKKAYVYSGGKLTSVGFDLPTPPLSDFLMKEDEAKVQPGDLAQMKKYLKNSYLYELEEDTLQVIMNTTDYSYADEFLKYPLYVWNGDKFVKK